jgi:hypothetical protein
MRLLIFRPGEGFLAMFMCTAASEPELSTAMAKIAEDFMVVVCRREERLATNVFTFELL